MGTAPVRNTADQSTVIAATVSTQNLVRSMSRTTRPAAISFSAYCAVQQSRFIHPPYDPLMS
jgi:hypothetical protein